MVNEIEVKELFEVLKSKQKGVLVIDVRTYEERKEGYIEGTLHIPLSEVLFTGLELAKENTLYFQCKSGVRSANACVSLMQIGFDKVFNIKGGIFAWEREGFKIKKDNT
jgi:rhodanese-related sulfurtransferase